MLSSLARSSFAPFARRAMSSTSPTWSTPLLLSPKEIDQNSVHFVDASWFINSPRKGSDEFRALRIPRASFLDLDVVASPNSLGLKHMMPSKQAFADACGKFGITPESHVVLYDTHGVFSSPRALFMFRSFGHDRSSVLDGGLPRWQDEGLPIETTSPAEVTQSEYPTPSLDHSVLRSYDQMVMNASINGELVLDARSRGRYLGTDPEPRPGLSSGHIPHSLSLPFNMFLQTHTTSDTSKTFTTLLPPSEIRKALDEAVGEDTAERIIQGKQSVITSCGSGMTAGVLWLGLRLLGTERVMVYDESWTGYAMRESSKIEKTLPTK